MRAIFALPLLVGMMLAGCGTSSGPQSATSPSDGAGAPLHYLYDSNAATAQNVDSLRFSVVALDPRNGHRIWHHPFEAPASDAIEATSHLVVQDGVIYASYYYFDSQSAIHHAVLEALDATTGQLRWRHEVNDDLGSVAGAGVGTEVQSAPLVAGGVVYFSAEVFGGQGGSTQETGLTAALDAGSGRVEWRHALAGAPSAPAITGQQLAVVVGAPLDSPSHLTALNAADGSVRWDYSSRCHSAAEASRHMGFLSHPR